jgi:polysaccharide biosynthesis transport protein
VRSPRSLIRYGAQEKTPYLTKPTDCEIRRQETYGVHLSYGGQDHALREELLLPELSRMIRTHWRVIAGCTAACLLLSLSYVALRSPLYEANAQIEISPAGTNSMGLDELTSRMINPSDPTIQLQSAVTVLQSKTVALAVMQQTRLAERRDFAGAWIQPPDADIAVLPPEARDHLLKRFQKNLRIEIVPKTDILSVQFRAKDPKLAADVVNATVSAYTERNFRSSYDATSQVSTWLSAQMDDLKLRANQAQEKLSELQKQRGLIGVDETDNIVTDKLKDLNEQLTAAESDRIMKEARYRIAESGNPELIASTVPEPTLQVLRSQQAQLRVDYARLSTKFGEGYPKLAELGNQMSQVDSAIKTELKGLSERYKNEYRAAADAERMLHAKFEEQKQKAYDLNQGAAKYAILKHEVETTQDLYQTLQLKLKQAGIMAGLASANIGVVEAAQVPSEPVDPRPPVDLGVGLASGVVVGLLSALGFEVLDSTVRNGEDAENVTALPTLAEIPYITRKRRALYNQQSASVEQDHSFRLVAHHQPLSPAAESYRALRTSLLQRAEKAPRVLVVTSCLPAEGKTSTAINCAVVLAQQGAKVLLIDADLRESKVHEVFGLAQDPGLTGLLAGIGEPDETIATSELLANLAVLAAGASVPFPAEMLASRRMASLLDEWRTRYDHIVLDTPPVSMFTDAAVLGSRADAVLLVARSGSTTKHALRHARDVMQRAQVNIAGVVLHGIDKRYESSYYHRYGYVPSSDRQRYLDS